MNLLIITQKIDIDDPVLGFFHGWVSEFSKNFEKITVICLEKGKHSLPTNVEVLSLGKEEGQSKFKYIFRFYKYIFRFRKDHDSVFVHMNQEYILLGGILWSLWHKKVSMWRNHHAGSFFTNLAVYLSDIVFCTSKYSYTAKFKKTVLMPVGIDTNLFTVNNLVTPKSNSILFLGRVSPVKNVHIFIEALKLLNKKGVDFSASIYGDSLPKDLAYYESLQNTVKVESLDGKIKFEKGIPNYRTVDIYNQHEIFVNLSSSGMYDKTIFEAMACGCTVFASNDNLKGQIDNFFIVCQDSPADLSTRLQKYIESKNSLDTPSFKDISQHQSLLSLSQKIKEYLSIDSNFKNKVGQILRYLISGAVVVAVDILFLHFFTNVFGIWYLLSSVVAFMIAFVVSFLLQKFWTFTNKSLAKIKGQLFKYFVASLVNLVVNTIMLYVFVDIFKINYNLGQVVTVGIIAVFLFFVYRDKIFNN